MKRLTGQEIAKAWGTSPQYVSKVRGQCSRSGEPMPDFRTAKEAKAWYASRRQRSPGDPVGEAPAPVAGGLCDGAEILSLSEMVARLENEDFDEIMVEHAQRVPIAAYRLYLQAVEAGNDTQVSQRIKNWGEAAKQAAAIREKFIEVQERNGQLLSLDIVMDVVGGLLQALVQALDTGGQKYAKRANPENPAVAQAAIHAFVDDIKRRVCESEARIREEVFNRTREIRERFDESAPAGNFPPGEFAGEHSNK